MTIVSATDLNAGQTISKPLWANLNVHMAVIKLRLSKPNVLQSVNTFWQDASIFSKCVYACLHMHKEVSQKATICRTKSDTVNECVCRNGPARWTIGDAKVYPSSNGGGKHTFTLNWQSQKGMLSVTTGASMRFSVQQAMHPSAQNLVWIESLNCQLGAISRDRSHVCRRDSASATVSNMDDWTIRWAILASGTHTGHRQASWH